MRFHEQQAKELLRKSGVPTQRGMRHAGFTVDVVVWCRRRSNSGQERLFHTVSVLIGDRHRGFLEIPAGLRPSAGPDPIQAIAVAAACESSTSMTVPFQPAHK